MASTKFQRGALGSTPPPQDAPRPLAHFLLKENGESLICTFSGPEMYRRWEALLHWVRTDKEWFAKSWPNTPKFSLRLLLEWWSGAYETSKHAGTPGEYIAQATAAERLHPELDCYHGRPWTPYNKTLFHLFLAEVGCQYQSPHSLRDIRRTAATRAACQKLGMVCFELKHPNDILSLKDPYGFESSSITATIEPCPWLHPDLEDTGPRFLWSIASNRTIDTNKLEYLPKYCVVSHTWGRWRCKTDTRKLNVEIEGVDWSVPILPAKLFDVTTLPEVLRRFAKLVDLEYVWFDLVCIPQVDVGHNLYPLKQQEVRNQATIFRRAHRGIMWSHDISDWHSIQLAIHWLALGAVAENAPPDVASDISILRQGVGAICAGFGKHGARPPPVACSITGSTLHQGLYPPPKSNVKDLSNLLEPSCRDPSAELNYIAPAVWFTSLWTLQEVILRPDMLLCNRNFELLSLDWGLLRNHQFWGWAYAPISKLRSPNKTIQGWRDANPDWKARAAKGQTVRNPLGLKHLRSNGDFTLPIAWDCIPALVALDKSLVAQDESTKPPPNVTRLERMLSHFYLKDMSTLTRAGILSMANRAQAIMSVLGTTKWFLAGETPQYSPEPDLVLGTYPLDFLQELLQEIGGLFFLSHYPAPEIHRAIPRAGFKLDKLENPGWRGDDSAYCRIGRLEASSLEYSIANSVEEMRVKIQQRGTVRIDTGMGQMWPHAYKEASAFQGIRIKRPMVMETPGNKEHTTIVGWELNRGGTARVLIKVDECRTGGMAVEGINGHPSTLIGTPEGEDHAIIARWKLKRDGSVWIKRVLAYGAGKVDCPIGTLLPFSARGKRGIAFEGVKRSTLMETPEDKDHATIKGWELRRNGSVLIRRALVLATTTKIDCPHRDIYVLIKWGCCFDIDFDRDPHISPKMQEEYEAWDNLRSLGTPDMKPGDSIVNLHKALERRSFKLVDRYEGGLRVPQYFKVHMIAVAVRWVAQSKSVHGVILREVKNLGEGVWVKVGVFNTVEKREWNEIDANWDVREGEDDEDDIAGRTSLNVCVW